MQLGCRGARISQRDIRELNDASERLALVANMIKRSHPAWMDDAIQLLIQANEVVVRIQNRGARVFQRYIEKHQVKRLESATAASVNAEPPQSVPQAAVELSEE